MSSLIISFITFLCLFVGALAGLKLGRVLPEHHLNSNSKEAIKIGTGLIATLTALVLGLLVSSAKSSFDTMNDEIKQGSATLILLDHALVKYGKEAEPTRETLKKNMEFVLDKIWPAENQKTSIHDVEKSPGIEAVRRQLEELKPQTDKERALQIEALQMCGELARQRWLLIQQSENVLPTPFISILIFWLTIFFISFGLLAPNNGTIIAVILVCTLSVSGAFYLILEMNRPLDGTIKISSAPLRKVLEHLQAT